MTLIYHGEHLISDDTFDSMCRGDFVTSVVSSQPFRLTTPKGRTLLKFTMRPISLDRLVRGKMSDNQELHDHVSDLVVERDTVDPEKVVGLIYDLSTMTLPKNKSGVRAPVWWFVSFKENHHHDALRLAYPISEIGRKLLEDDIHCRMNPGGYF